MPALLIALVGLTGVAGGAIAAVSGFGIGSLLTPVLAVELGTKVAVALVSIPHLAATAVRLWMLRRSVDLGVLRTFGLASAAGGLAGALLHAFVSSPLLSVALGLLLVLSGLVAFLDAGERLALRGPWAVAEGVLSGVFGGLAGNQGGIRSAALVHYRLDRRAFVATATASGVIVDLARVPVYMVTSGPELAERWSLVAFMIGAVLVGTVAGAPLLRRIPEGTFRRLVALLIVGLGLGLIAGLAG